MPCHGDGMSLVLVGDRLRTYGYVGEKKKKAEVGSTVTNLLVSVWAATKVPRWDKIRVLDTNTVKFGYLLISFHTFLPKCCEPFFLVPPHARAYLLNHDPSHTHSLEMAPRGVGSCLFFVFSSKYSCCDDTRTHAHGRSTSSRFGGCRWWRFALGDAGSRGKHGKTGRVERRFGTTSHNGHWCP